jgi:DNA-binding NtrC family response regulator
MSQSVEQNHRARILIVDDEEMVTLSLSAFLTLETDYDVVTFTLPTEAIDYVRRNNIDLVISDYLMPSMDGVTLLTKLKDISPQATRILLTGYADKENAIRAINEAGLFHYIEKPWDNDDLKIIIRNGLEKRRLLRELQTKVDEIQRAYADLQRLQRDILKAFA